MQGNHETWQFENRNIHVYTPPTYSDDASALFPAVFVQDGSYLFADSMEELEADFARGVTQEVIFVGIEPVERTCEYTPWEAAPLMKGEHFGGEGDAYLSFVTEKVKPFVRERYRIADDASQTGITGGSLGGADFSLCGFSKAGTFRSFRFNVRITLV
ncbi:alpha/beta hydrolase [Paenibacillus oceani]|uniref:Alpha/beta hydrolase n=1 Tax=Paenibacillus oceani TaxID=2772510 RepID=A0A927CF49_9BACL|nr:alpha/beta hydrolase-fold protein [Paenibacillus oceani]MBD2864640.1 alpha/beta hydrolase [Paenibacillus oceani]